MSKIVDVSEERYVALAQKAVSDLVLGKLYWLPVSYSEVWVFPYSFKLIRWFGIRYGSRIISYRPPGQYHSGGIFFGRSNRGGDWVKPLYGYDDLCRIVLDYCHQEIVRRREQDHARRETEFWG